MNSSENYVQNTLLGVKIADQLLELTKLKFAKTLGKDYAITA